MAFNSLMIRLAAEALAWAPPTPSIVELGNQTFKPRGAILSEIREYLTRQSWRWDATGFDAITRLTGEEKLRASSQFLRTIGYGPYTCIDVNDRYGAVQMDLNLELAIAHGFTDTFDVVTNNGTGEHVFDQASVFRNMHKLAKLGGLFLHVLPFHNYTNHGFYNFQPVLFHDLARANGYELLKLSIATAIGDEVAFLPNAIGDTTRKIKSHPLADAIARSTAWPGWRDIKPDHLARSRRNLGKAMRSLSVKRANILVVAVMRKTTDSPFRYPMQGMYSDANISSAEIAQNYGQSK